jgi:glycosyltransferase involved in cell wall biosynthesis
VPLLVHTIHDLPQNYARRPIVKWIYRELERRAARLCDHVFTTSETNLEQIVAEGIAKRQDVSIVRPGLEMHLFSNVKSREEQRRLWGVPNDVPLIGMVARLEPAKDQDSLLRAFASLLHPTAQLVITGRGHREAPLRQLAQELGIAKRVLFTGWVENQLDAINALDLFVLSSHYEGLGVVLLEALALRVPVISTLVGGTRDVLRHNETGLLVPPRNPVALAAAIDEMLTHPERARALAEAGRVDVLQRYLVENSNREQYAVYERLWRAASTS